MKDIGSYVLFVMDYSSWMGITDLFFCVWIWSVRWKSVIVRLWSLRLSVCWCELLSLVSLKWRILLQSWFTRSFFCVAVSMSWVLVIESSHSYCLTFTATSIIGNQYSLKCYTVGNQHSCLLSLTLSAVSDLTLCSAWTETESESTLFFSEPPDCLQHLRSLVAFFCMHRDILQHALHR